MSHEPCCVCQKTKTTLQCGLCQGALCKNCAQFLEADQFAFLPTLPEKLKHSTYCGPCFSEHVEPEIHRYNEDLQKAKNLTVFFVGDSKLTRNFKRNEKPLKVTHCTDREETLVRLAFLAVQSQFNALIDVDIKSEKVREGSYQTTRYSGTAMPVNLTSQRLM